MRNKNFFYGSISTTIDGIEEALYKGIVLSYQNDSEDILLEIVDSVEKILTESIDTATTIIFERNLRLIKKLYPLSLTNGKYSNFLKKTSYRTTRYAVSSVLYRLERKENESNKEIYVKDFLNYGLTLYNQILHDILLEKDFETYKFGIEEFYSYVFKRVTDESNNSKDKLTIEAEYYINSVAILQYSWILYLYKKNKLTQSECLQVLNKNHFSAKNYERIIDTLIYIDNLSHFKTFGVDDWEEDIVKRRQLTSYSSISYSPLQPKSWTSFGMMIFFLKNLGGVTRDFNISRIKSAQKYFETYFDEFQNALSEIKNNKDIWIPIIFNNTLSDTTTPNSNHEEDFYSRIEHVSNYLKIAALKLGKFEFVNNTNTLASEPFSHTKIIEYREAVGEQWYNRSFLHKLFEKYGNYTIIENSDAIIPTGIVDTFQPKMKMMFVENGYNYVYGSSDFGGKIADYEDGDFLESIKTADKPVRLFYSIIDCLDTLIESIKTNKFSPTVIIIDYHWKYSTNELMSSPDFIPDWDVKNNEDNYNSNFSLYKNIPVYTSFNEKFKNYVVVSDFSNAFILNQVQNDNWYKKQLQVDTTPISDAEAKRRFDLDPNGWKKTPSGFELSEEEALNEIKTAIIWDINVKEIFQVQNSLAYEIGQIQNIESNAIIDINPV